VPLETPVQAMRFNRRLVKPMNPRRSSMGARRRQKRRTDICRGPAGLYDSPLEQAGFELAVPFARISPQGARRQFQGRSLSRDRPAMTQVKLTMI
jgi:hypothetical protein